MSKLPQIKRLFIEDFVDQKEWIERLITPLNGFMDGVMICLNKGISVKDNCSGDIIKQTVLSVPSETSPLTIPWDIKRGTPVALYIGDVKRADGTSFTLATAVFAQWKYAGKDGIIITNLLGITPTTDLKYNLTFVIFTG